MIEISSVVNLVPLKTVTSRKVTSLGDCMHVTLIESCVWLQLATNWLSLFLELFLMRKILSMKRYQVTSKG